MKGTSRQRVGTVAIAWAAWAALALVASGAAGAVAEEAPRGEREEISFWFYSAGTLGLQFQEIAHRFNEVQDRYYVKTTMMPWNSNQKVLSSLAAGIPPDVLMVDRPAAPGWILRGALEDITPYVQREGWSDEAFFSAPWRDGQYEGRTYVIPVHSDIRCLIYNRDLFREAGLDPEAPPRTWDELHAYAERLTVRDERGRVTQLGFAMDYNLLLVLGWQLGADLASEDLKRITLDRPEYVEALTYIKRLVDIVGTDDYLRFLSMSGAALESQDAFFNGRIAMRLVEGFYLTRQRRFAPDMDARLAPFPMPTAEEEPISWISGFGLAMPRGVRNPEGAWAFIRHMASEESQFAIGADMGEIPVLRSVAHRPEIYDDPSRKPLVDMADRCRFYPKVPVIMETYNEAMKAVETTLYGRATPKEALAAAQRTAQESLDRYLWREGLPLFPWRAVAWPLIGIAAIAAAYLLHRARTYAQRGVRQRKELLTGYAFVSPWLFGVVVLMLGPMVVSVIYSLCDYQVLKPARWAGLTNYQRMLTEDPLFWKSLWNTVYYTAFAVPMGMALALLLAVLLNQPLRGMRVFRTIFFLPTLVTGVALGVLWMWLLQPEYGVVNRALGLFGIRGPLWLQSEVWSKPALIFMSLWGVGGSVLIFLAGLQGIPRELYEAAEIDGAGFWRKFTNVTLPLLTPTIFFILVVGIIGSFQVFTQAYVVSGGLGGPLDSTLFYVFYLYRKGFEDFQMGYASAMAWVLFVVVFVLTLLQLRLSRRWVHY